MHENFILYDALRPVRETLLPLIALNEESRTAYWTMTAATLG